MSVALCRAALTAESIAVLIDKGQPVEGWQFWSPAEIAASFGLRHVADGDEIIGRLVASGHLEHTRDDRLVVAHRPQTAPTRGRRDIGPAADAPGPDATRQDVLAWMASTAVPDVTLAGLNAAVEAILAVTGDEVHPDDPSPDAVYTRAGMLLQLLRGTRAAGARIAEQADGLRTLPGLSHDTGGDAGETATQAAASLSSAVAALAVAARHVSDAEIALAHLTPSADR